MGKKVKAHFFVFVPQGQVIPAETDQDIATVFDDMTNAARYPVGPVTQKQVAAGNRETMPVAIDALMLRSGA